MTKPITVILSKDNALETVPYYCIHCNRYFFDMNRDAVVIYQGNGYPLKNIPYNMGFVNISCHRCKTNYTFYFQ